MAGALGVVITTDVPMGGQRAQPVYVDDGLPIVGPAQAIVVTTGEVPQMGGPPLAVRLAPAGTPAIGPALPVYVVSGSLGAASAPSFVPTDITGLIWDFDPDVLSAGAISSLADSSGNGHTATQGTGASQPIAVANEVNGHTIMRFDGVDDRLVTASIAHGIGAGDFFYVTVARTASSLSGYHTICSNGSFLPAFYLNGNKVDVYIVGDKNGATVLSASTVYTILGRRLSGTLEYYVNGTIDANTFANVDTIPDGISTLGDEANSTASPWNSDLARVIFGKTLSNTDRDLLTSYLRTKYAHY